MIKSTYLLTGLLCFFALISFAQTTSTYRVISSADDAIEKNNGDIKAFENELEMGDDQMVGLRFQNVTVPSGATITSAYIELIASGDEDKNTASVLIYGELNAYPLAYFETDYNISARTLTSASMTWALGNWEKNETYTSPDLSSLIQEIIDLEEWVNANSLALVIESTGDKKREAYSFNKDPQLAATLTISYTGGVSPADITDHVNNDLDMDPENEWNTDAQLTGTDLEITDAGATLVVDLSSLEESADIEAEALRAQAAESAIQADVDQNEADADDAIATLQADVDQNEADTDDAIATLQADVDQNETDADDAIATLQADVDQNEADTDDAITTLQADVDQNETDADDAIAVNTASINSHVNLDLDIDHTNEYNTGANLVGTSLRITDGGGTKTVDLSTLATDQTTASNGLIKSGTDIKMGGSIVQNTSIGVNSKNISYETVSPHSVDVSQTQSSYYASASSNVNRWQSWTCNTTGYLSAIKLRFLTSHGEKRTMRVYSGEGTGGTLLATSTFTKSSYSLINIYEPVEVIAGNTYTFQVVDISGIVFIKENKYTGGKFSEDDNWDLYFQIFNSASPSDYYLHMNGSSGHVGIGTNNPQAKLHLKGDLRIDDGTQGNGKVLTSDASGNASWQALPSSFKKDDEPQESQIDLQKFQNELTDTKNWYQNALDEKEAQINALLERVEQIEMDLQHCCLKQSQSRSDDFGQDYDLPFLGQNIPNPYRSRTTIEYYLPANQNDAQIRIYDQQGREIKSYELLESGFGQIEVQWANESSGVYYYDLIINDTRIARKKMIFQN